VGGEAKPDEPTKPFQLMKGHLGRAKELDCLIDWKTTMEQLWDLWDTD